MFAKALGANVTAISHSESKKADAEKVRAFPDAAAEPPRADDPRFDRWARLASSRRTAARRTTLSPTLARSTSLSARPVRLPGLLIGPSVVLTSLSHRRRRVDAHPRLPLAPPPGRKPHPCVSPSFVTSRFSSWPSDLSLRSPMHTVVGAPEKPLPPLPAFPFIMGNVHIGGSAIGSPKLIQEMLELAAKQGVKSWIEKRDIKCVPLPLPLFCPVVKS